MAKSQSQKQAELCAIKSVYRMGVESLSPENFSAMISVFNSLAVTRGLYEPAADDDAFEAYYLDE